MKEEPDIARIAALIGDRDRAEPRMGGCCRLPHYAAIRVTGRDAGTFLNRQLTCDVGEVTPELSGFGAWCTPKGRVITLLHLVRRPDALYLLLPEELRESTLQRLRMFVLRDEVIFASDGDDALAVLGFMGEAALAGLEAACGVVLPGKPRQSVQGKDFSIVRWPGADCPRVIMLGTGTALERALQSPAKALSPCTFEHWQLQDIRAGIPDITGATRESFIPQMINLERIGGVSFTKGCYPGQEIVARTQHLGRIKRRMFIGHIEHCPVLPGAGTTLVGEDGENLAGIVNCADNGKGGAELLAVAALAKAANALYLETPDGQRHPVKLVEPGYGFEDPGR